ncbi:6-phosphofructokinase [Treponema primitia ZAS-2]|uniref:ATP-dependent 6-phosphofructokinase n=1 Tax=Treponema primitia (strain ATCC BAA-887 / DSM 12427 / ZAS-2) TaxID=545694 RepID=F5YIC2_TREPZ|nr:ATP-dependent 6-phosphofructokinase [Treponema primitia]AEF84667.1 6-phosphofructokinase [Treponema primitia ZAS-2]
MAAVEQSATKTFGILTAGGDCPGLNAAIRGVCRAAHDRYNMTAVGIANGYRGLIDEDWRILRPVDFMGILTRGGTILGASREKPFKARPKEYSSDIEEDKVELIKENYRKLNLDCLVVLGGNGTNTTGYLLAKEGLNVLGLPKTIDNDIIGTDRTFGFHSALSIATEAIDRLHSTAQSHNRVMIIELMGHKAGWLALYAGIAGGGDVILIPEIPYDIKAIGRHLEKRTQSGRGFSIVVVAEGAMSIEEAAMDKKERKKYREQTVVPSIGYRIAGEIEAETGLETRATVLGYVQRGGIPSASDRVLATSLGTAAAKLLAKGEYGRMVALKGESISSVDLRVPAEGVKTVPQDHYMIDTAISVGTCMGV